MHAPEFPPEWAEVATLLADVGGPPVELAWLLGQPLHFFYLRGPHLTPPQQVAGLTPTRLAEMVRRLGWETEPLTEAVHTEGSLCRRTEGGWVLRLDALPVIPTATPHPEWHRLLAVPPPPADAGPLLREALVANAYGMMICSGAWQGVDGIEFASEDLVRWSLGDGWQGSAGSIAATLARGGGLWRGSFAHALQMAAGTIPEAGPWPAMWAELGEQWLALGERFHRLETSGDVGALPDLSRRLLRMAGAESRAWGRVIDAVGAGI